MRIEQNQEQRVITYPDFLRLLESRPHRVQQPYNPSGQAERSCKPGTFQPWDSPIF